VSAADERNAVASRPGDDRPYVPAWETPADGELFLRGGAPTAASSLFPVQVSALVGAPPAAEWRRWYGRCACLRLERLVLLYGRRISLEIARWRESQLVLAENGAVNACRELSIEGYRGQSLEIALLPEGEPARPLGRLGAGERLRVGEERGEIAIAFPDRELSLAELLRGDRSSALCLYRETGAQELGELLPRAFPSPLEAS
jgi:hypothetical protein